MSGRSAVVAAGRDVLGEGGEPVAVYRALSDPLRWRLLGHLCRRGLTSRRELEQVLGVSKTVLTHHTRVLLHAGLIAVQGRRRALSYAVRPGALEQLEGWLADPRAAGTGGVACVRR